MYNNCIYLAMVLTPSADRDIVGVLTTASCRACTSCLSPLVTPSSALCLSPCSQYCGAKRAMVEDSGPMPRLSSHSYSRFVNV